MKTPLFELAVARGREAHTVCLSGEIDFAASLQLLPRMEEVVRECPTELLIDLASVTFIDSEGIKMLLAALDRMRRKEGRAKVIDCSDQVRRVLHMAGVEDLFGCAAESGVVY